MPLMLFKYDRRTARVASIAEAVRIWNTYREGTAAGCSQIGNGGKITVARKLVATVSYNGRAWDPDGKPLQTCDRCGEGTGDEGDCGPCFNCGMPGCLHGDEHDHAGDGNVCPKLPRGVCDLRCCESRT